MNNAELLNNIADIELPAPPNWQPSILLAIIIIFLLLFLLLLVLQQRSKSIRNENTALEQLMQIQHNWKSKTTNNRDTAYQLATLLRLGLKLDQLDADTCPNVIFAHQVNWHDTVTQLKKLRYEKHQKVTLKNHTFDNIKNWLLLEKQHNEQLAHQTKE